MPVENGRCQYKLVITILHEWHASGQTVGAGMNWQIPQDMSGMPVEKRKVPV